MLRSNRRVPEPANFHNFTLLPNFSLIFLNNFSKLSILLPNSPSVILSFSNIFLISIAIFILSNPPNSFSLKNLSYFLVLNPSCGNSSIFMSVFLNFLSKISLYALFTALLKNSSSKRSSISTPLPLNSSSISSSFKTSFSTSISKFLFLISVIALLPLLSLSSIPITITLGFMPT